MRFFTAEEAAPLLELRPETVRRFCRSGRLQAVHVAGVWRLPETSLAEFQNRWSAARAARHLGLKVDTLVAYIRRGHLQAARRGGRWEIRREDLAKFEGHYSSEEVAALLRISVQTVLRLCRSGRLQARRFGNAWRIPREALPQIPAQPKFTPAAASQLDSERFLRVDEVARELKFHVATVRALLREGRLPGVRFFKREWLVPRNALRQFKADLVRRACENVRA